jgi:hypothetical protein
MLPPGGVLLMQVRQHDGGSFALALITGELEAVFGEVRESKRSWDSLRRYYFPKPPRACQAFRVEVEVPDIDPVEAGALHDWAEASCQRINPDLHAESVKPYAALREWRNACRPEKVRILLVAKSHLREQLGDCGVRVDLSSYTDRELPSESRTSSPIRVIAASFSRRVASTPSSIQVAICSISASPKPRVVIAGRRARGAAR